jgi:hypothetical protein
MSDDIDNDKGVFVDYESIYLQYLDLKKTNPQWQISNFAQALNVSYAFMRNAIMMHKYPTTFKHYHKGRSIKKSMERKAQPYLKSVTFQLHEPFQAYFKMEATRLGMHYSQYYRMILDEFMEIYDQLNTCLESIGFDFHAFEPTPFEPCNECFNVDKAILAHLDKLSQFSLCNSRSEVIRFALFYRFLKDHHFFIE